MEKIPNPKSQIPNKSQNPKTKISKVWKFKFGAWNLFVIWCLVLGIFVGFSSGVLAHTDPNSPFWLPGEPIVPCGQVNDFQGSPDDERVPCDQCQLWHLLKHLVDFILIAAAPILATVFFIVAGVYMILGGANPGMLSQGKSIFKNTFIGLLIVMLAWLITNTLINSLVAPNFGGNPLPWYEFYCSNS